MRMLSIRPLSLHWRGVIEIQGPVESTTIISIHNKTNIGRNTSNMKSKSNEEDIKDK